MLLCDTDVLIEILKGNEEIRAEFETLSDQIALSAITVMELYFGALNKRELYKIKRFVSGFEIFLVNEEVSQAGIRLIEKYAKSHGLRIPDALIAATALIFDLALWTLNVRDFRFIEGLKLWSPR
ncbi:MAG TPA: type II toxin-antitoxin system VapC family toxin [Thermosulfurimonas dismutans]|uniref:Ribonuclease VapC n=1 Tax=Thermosulfurimonas dismutans TaxID=999894 RepID=A0A7C3CTS7_9BACT|nr:type II toxin-antitoxin system VapC family toxin [Thermosulfurimonas dismutans]